MNTPPACQRIVRVLHTWEIDEARRVFATGLKYEVVRIHECATWPDTINTIGRRLKGLGPTDAHNAITIGNHIYFPVQFPDYPIPFGHNEHYKICWLIHELTHAWQYQTMGWSYLIKAITSQLKEKGGVYDFGQEPGLKKRKNEGWKLGNFNLEQQGDITRSYYERLLRGEDISAWQPFIDEIQHRVI